MSEQRTMPEVLPGDLITGPGVYMSRSNNPVEVRDCGNGYWEAAWEHGDLRYHSSGERVGVSALDDPYQLIRWVGPLAEDIPTTSEQLAEIEGQAESVWVCEGWWRTRRGEIKYIRAGGSRRDTHYSWPWTDGLMCFQDNGFYQASKPCDDDLVEYLGLIEPEPEPQPEPVPVQVQVQVQVCEGRWRTRNGLVRDVTAMPPNHEDFAAAYPWWDGVSTWRNDGRWLAGGSTMDLVEYLGPIEEQPHPQPVPEPEPENSITPDNVAGQALAGVWNQAKAERTIEELRCEVSYVQRLLGESRQRVTQLEELASSLRTINEAQEKAVEAANKENTALRLQVQNRQQEHERQKGRIEFLETLNAGNGAAIGDYKAQVEKLQGLVDTARGQLETAATEHDSLSAQLAAVKAELVTQAETSRQLRIELDAAQQVPADSPELRQLRLDLAEVTQDRDTYRHAHEELLHDVNATHQRTKVMTIEAIVEWLVPIRTCGSQALATAVISNLPHIMRSLTGLEDEDTE